MYISVYIVNGKNNRRYVYYCKCAHMEVYYIVFHKAWCGTNATVTTHSATMINKLSSDNDMGCDAM